MSCSGRCWLPPRGRSAPPVLLLCPPPPCPLPPSSSAAAEPCGGQRRQQRRRGRSLARGAPCLCRGRREGAVTLAQPLLYRVAILGAAPAGGIGSGYGGRGYRLAFPPPPRRGTGPRRRGATGRARRLAPPPAPLLTQGDIGNSCKPQSVTQRKTPIIIDESFTQGLTNS